MSKRNRMPGLRFRNGLWHIEKRCKDVQGGWLRESTETASRAEAEQYLIRRLTEIEQAARRHEAVIYSFEEAGMRYLEEIAQKPSSDIVAMHLDQLFPFVGQLALEHIHDGTLKPFVDQESARGIAHKSINNAIGVVAAVLNKAARVWRTEDGTP